MKQLIKMKDNESRKPMRENGNKVFTYRGFLIEPHYSLAYS